MVLSIGDDETWSAVVAHVERAIDLDASARKSGVLTRKRQVRSAGDLLRLAMAYGPAGGSLRVTAAWAEEQGIANLSDVGLMYRLRDSAEWLGEVAGALLAQRKPKVEGAGLRIRLVDATHISPPGKRTRWRLHGTYDLGEERFSRLDLTTAHTAEALELAPAEAGDLIVADRVYARPDGLHALAATGAELLVRVGSRSLKLTSLDGSAFDLKDVLARSRRNGFCDQPVLVLDGGDPEREPLPLRLVVLRKPTEAAAKARKLALRESQRGGHDNAPLSLEAAEHMMLVTTLAAEDFSPQQVGDLYRLRWQIEVAFKRLKSLVRIDRLPAKTESLARAWIYAHLIAAFIVEDFSPQLRADPP
jgi:hypothetical protein